MHKAIVARVVAFAALAVVCPAPIAAQQAHISLDWAPHRNTGSLVPFMASVISPEVNKKLLPNLFRTKR